MRVRFATRHIALARAPQQARGTSGEQIRETQSLQVLAAQIGQAKSGGERRVEHEAWGRRAARGEPEPC
eukprot:7730650-Pyramimonas_sp.AAC.1